ncbi:MAG TPA: hypothetical protein VIJ47_00950 [Acidimicrobiales bacterium]
MRNGRSDRGAGLIGLIAGVSVFLVFLLFAVQLLINLYATSSVTDAAWDGARQVAGARIDHGDPSALVTAEAAGDARMRAELGRFSERVTFDWSGTDADSVVVRVRGTTPRFGLPGISVPLGFDAIDRTVRVRVEVLR